MKILFVAPLQKDANVQNWGAPSLALIRIISYLKANLKDRNIEYFIYDQQIDNYDPFARWEKDLVEFLGISTLHYTNIQTFDFIRRWREIHPETFIVAGGNEASANYQDLFDKCSLDAVALVEGEQVMLDLVRWKLSQKKLEDISGIIYRRYAEPVTEEKFWDYWKDVDFSEFQYPKYWAQTAALFEKPNYEEVYCIRLTPSSHCQRNCTFCSLSLVRNYACGKNIKPVALRGWQIMELVHKIKRQLPQTRTLYFCNDDIFYPHRKYFEEFIDLYAQSGYDYRILVQTSSYSLRETDFPNLKRINCQHITVGVESASARIQKSLCKPQDMEKIEQTIEWSQKYGIPIYYLIILIPPESTMEDLVINYETISHWQKQGVGISIMPVVYAYRGMPLFEDSRYQILYKPKEIPGTRRIYNDPYCVLPNDPIIRKLTLEFLEREQEFVDQVYQDKDNKLKFKGGTSGALLRLLRELIEKYS